MWGGLFSAVDAPWALAVRARLFPSRLPTSGKSNCDSVPITIPIFYSYFLGQPLQHSRGDQLVGRLLVPLLQLERQLLLCQRQR